MKIRKDLDLYLLCRKCEKSMILKHLTDKYFVY